MDKDRLEQVKELVDSADGVKLSLSTHAIVMALLAIAERLDQMIEMHELEAERKEVRDRIRQI